MKAFRRKTSFVFTLAAMCLIHHSARAQDRDPTHPPDAASEIVSKYPEYQYYNAKQPIKLRYDSNRIALYQSAQFRAVDPAVQLAAADVAAAAVRKHPIDGWHLVDLAEAPGGVGAIDAVVNRVGTVPGVDFVSPVFLDESGQPLIVTPDILVGVKRKIAPAAARSIVETAEAGVVTDVDYAGMRGVYRVSSASRSGLSVLAAANALAVHPSVEFSEPDFIQTCQLADFPNDPLFDACWYLNNPTGQNSYGCLPPGPPEVDMDALEAWQTSRGDPSIILTVFDVGIALNHPDLNSDPALGADFTGQGGGGNPVYPSDCHGTAVAGVITARLNNHLGIVGVAPECRVASARVIVPTAPNVQCYPNGITKTSWQVEGLAWAESIGARVTNWSFGSAHHAQALERKFEETHARGMVHFAAAHNQSKRWVPFPARFPIVNAVSGLDNQPALAAFSNYGPAIDFSAPATCFVSTDRVGAEGYNTSGPFEDYAFGLSGTSGAAPCAAGVAALILSVNPSLSADDVEAIMRQSAVDLGTPGWDEFYGWGFVNADAALAAIPMP